MTTTEFIKRFKYAGGSLIAPWKDISESGIGDCQDFAWTVLKLETGGFVPAIKAILTGRAMIWRCWSSKNGLIPRHAVLWLKGKGWIDSTKRKWRDSPEPHRRAWPAGLVLILGLVWAGRTFGVI